MGGRGGSRQILGGAKVATLILMFTLHFPMMRGAARLDLLL